MADIDMPGLKLRADTVDHAAHGILELLFIHYRGQPIPTLIGSAQIERFEYGRLLCGWRTLRVGAGVGDGVTRNVVRRCIELIVQKDDLFKSTRDDLFTWMFPADNSTDDERLAWAKVLGTLVAIHIVWLKASPCPIDPILVVLLMAGMSSALDQKYITILHPSLAAELAVWPSYEERSNVFDDQQNRGPLNMLIASWIPNYSFPAVRRITTMQGWSNITKTLLVSALFGHPVGDFENSPELDAIRSGFNLPIRGRVLPSFPSTTLSSFSLRLIFLLKLVDTQDDILPVISALAGQKVLASREVMDLVVFSEGHFQHRDPAFLAAFRLRLSRYLCGVGHPSCLVGENTLITAETAAVQSQNALFRATTFLRQATGSDLLPRMPERDASKIKISFALPDPSIQAGKVTMHQCTRTVIINVDDHLVSMIKDIPADYDPSSEDDDVPFCEFFHKNLLNVAGLADYDIA
ncbi:hypothetical protein V5O48_012506 [Marasmius crinis-equi]|uniref:Uncharacterized protein n=1 Tax=Marasmius crinis-equi TaxID=585013 RepID=A0ABR3F315_9AGAR